MKYNTDKGTLEYNGAIYPVVLVKDHLQNITESITQAISLYTQKMPVALDFSNLRERGSKTSSTGTSTGAASFAETMDNMVLPIRDDSYPYIPLALMKETHLDFEEFKTVKLEMVPKLWRSEDWYKIELVKFDLPSDSVPESNGKITPYWELDSKEQAKIREQREKDCLWP